MGYVEYLHTGIVFILCLIFTLHNPKHSRLICVWFFFVWTCVFRIGGICSICSLLMLNCIPTYIWLKFFKYLIWIYWISLFWFCYNLFKINNALIGAYKIGTTLILWFILQLYFPLQSIFYLGSSYLLEKKITKKCHNVILLPKLFWHTVRKKMF
jgi:hypothetical protein